MKAEVELPNIDTRNCWLTTSIRSIVFFAEILFTLSLHGSRLEVFRSGHYHANKALYSFVVGEAVAKLCRKDKTSACPPAERRKSLAKYAF